MMKLNEVLLKGREVAMMTVPINKMFLDHEIRRALIIWLAYEGDRRHLRLVTEVVMPAMERINQLTHQKNDADYIASELNKALNGAVRQSLGG
jgi:hypothetical protein